MPATDSDDLTEPWRFQYPFPSRYATIDGRRMHYIDVTGQGGEASEPAAVETTASGGNSSPRTNEQSPLLFVHGNPTWSFAFRNLIHDLSRDRRCIAVDHIGCGLSDKPGDYPYTLSQHVANLVAFIEQLDLTDMTLVGHDWGGCIGMGAAVERPERFSRLVVMNTAAFRSTRIPLRIAACRIPLLGTLAVRGLNAFARAAVVMAVHHRETMTPAVRSGYLAPYDSWAHRVAVERFVKDIPLRPSHPGYAYLKSIEDRLPTLRDRPMQLIWGERDWCFTTEFLEEWERRFPSARVERIADASHYLFEDAPQRVIATIRQFLAETSPTVLSQSSETGTP